MSRGFSNAVGGGGVGNNVGDVTLKNKSGNNKFLECNGQNVEIEDYPELVNILWSEGGGFDWTVLPNPPATGTGNNVSAFGNGIFLFAYSISTWVNNIYRSEDNGLTWVSVLSAGSSTITCITYGENRFCAVIGGAIYISDETGLTWTNITTFPNTGANYKPYYMYNAKGLYVVTIPRTTASLTTCTYTSADLITWTEGTGTPNGIIMYNDIDDYFLQVSPNTGSIFKSSDGYNWTNTSLSTNTSSCGVYNHHLNLFIIVTKNAFYTYNGSTLVTRYTTGTTVAINDIISSPSLIITGTNEFFVTSDGINWTASGMDAVLLTGAYGDGVYIARCSTNTYVSYDQIQIPSYTVPAYIRAIT